MNRATTAHPSHANRRNEDTSLLHFKRFLEAFSAPGIAGSATGMQTNTQFRVLHVKRPLGTIEEIVRDGPSTDALPR
jgi:hypothetical protein